MGEVEKLLTAAEVAAITRNSTPRVCEMARLGILPAIRSGRSGSPAVLT